MRKSMQPLALFIAAAVLASTPVAAQQFSDEELLQLFKAQRDAFRAAGQSTTGRTRGLTLMTVDDLAPGPAPAALPAPGGAEPAASVPQPGAEVSAGPSPAGLEAPVADARPATGATISAATALQPLAPASEDQPQKVVFGALAPELQVNVNIRFGFDSAALAADQKPVLAQLCKVMKDSDIKQFRIVGHTDSTGGDAYNEKLSKLRAEEVERYFVKDCGIAAQRLEAIGMGERFPANQIDPKAAENRRVEFQALS